MAKSDNIFFDCSDKKEANHQYNYHYKDKVTREQFDTCKKQICNSHSNMKHTEFRQFMDVCLKLD
jgi:hypothetical protein